MTRVKYSSGNTGLFNLQVKLDQPGYNLPGVFILLGVFYFARCKVGLPVQAFLIPGARQTLRKERRITATAGAHLFESRGGEGVPRTAGPCRPS